jgi:Raf kinase inhibitor-like YbhB/YbcL family protein
MVRLFSIFLGLCSLLYAAAPNPVAISLTGTVKDNTGKAIEGVTVSLAKTKNLSAKTSSTGAFKLSNATGVISPENQNASFSFTFRNNVIVFNSPSGNISGKISIFSGEGRLISTVNLNNSNSKQEHVALPELSSGMYVLAGNVGGESFTQPLVCMGNNLYLKNKTMESANSGLISLRKSTTAAVVDTLIAWKDTYDSTRVPLTSYSKENIEVVLAKKGVFSITSTKFVEGDSMPDAYTCEGKAFGGGIAPPLEWSGVPSGAKSLAIFFKDLTMAASSTPSYGYHWGMWNIPITITKMPENLGSTATLPDMGGAQQYGAMGTKFFGPCPSSASKIAKDTYAFILYAFDKEKITPTSTTDLQKLDKYFDDNDIAKTQISVWSDAKPK